MVRIGIDLGGTNIAAGLVGEGYRLLAKKSVPTGAQRPPEAIVSDMAALCRSLAEENGLTLAACGPVGVAAPGAVDPEEGTVSYSANLPFYDYPLAEALSALLDGQEVRLANDANAAALAESVAGAAKGTQSSVMITLGTGVGGGVILGGKILVGVNGAAAELGHIVIREGGVLCSCGRRGCFEAYASATALVRRTRESLVRAVALGIPTRMLDAVGGDPARASARTAFTCMREGDAEAAAVVDAYIRDLAVGVTDIVNIFQPEVLSIGGGLSGEGESLLAPLAAIVEREQYTRRSTKKTRICIAELGNDAGIIGAAAL